LHRELFQASQIACICDSFCKGGTYFVIAQLFPKSANVYARVVIVGIVVLACGAESGNWSKTAGSAIESC
jgi:hypothetical protein